MEKKDVTPMFSYDADHLVMVSEYLTNYEMQGAPHKLDVDSNGVMHVRVLTPVWSEDDNCYFPAWEMTPLEDWFNEYIDAKISEYDLPF